MCVEFVDDCSEVEEIDLETFGQPIGPPPGFSGNDDEHDNYHDIDDLWSYYFCLNFEVLFCILEIISMSFCKTQCVTWNLKFYYCFLEISFYVFL